MKGNSLAEIPDDGLQDYQKALAPRVIIHESNGDPHSGAGRVNAARSIRSPRRMGRPLERKAGRLFFIDKGYIISELHGKEAP